MISSQHRMDGATLIYIAAGVTLASWLFGSNNDTETAAAQAQRAAEREAEPVEEAIEDRYKDL